MTHFEVFTMLGIVFFVLKRVLYDSHTREELIHQTLNIEPGRHQRAKRQKRVRVSDNALETDRSVLKRSPLICDIHGGFFKISLHFWVLAYIRQTGRLRVAKDRRLFGTTGDD